MGLLSVIEDISVFKQEYMDMGVPALVGQGEVGEVKLRERVASSGKNKRQIGMKAGTKKVLKRDSHTDIICG